MTDYKFYYPIQVRWMDLDTQWHVNNARFLSFLESGRLAYLRRLGLFDGKSFHELGLIVANVHLSFLAPIDLDQNIRVGVKVARIGNKSMDFCSQIEDADTGKVMATSKTVMVAYNYLMHSTIPVPEEWRAVVEEFEKNINKE